jgi:molybdopterin molybdotransferase
MAAREQVEIEDARDAVLRHAVPLDPEPVQVTSAALGRISAEDVAAGEPVPGFDNSAMDGYAVRSEDARRSPVTLSVVGESRAGAPAAAALAAGEAIAISTGAMLPQGADAVVRVEDTRGRVEVLVGPAAGENVRRAGEDILPGATVLGRGSALGAAELGVLASVGRTEVLCGRRPRASVLVTGDELLAPGEPMRPGGVRDSSSVTISALARAAGAELVHAARTPDEPAATREALAIALENADVAIVCGGVSVGEHDHVRAALGELGAEPVFWGLALRPGSPTWFGTAGPTLVFGLPGNPVSAVVTFTLLAAPAIRALQGASEPSRRASAILDCDYPKATGRAHAVRCALTAAGDGWHARPTGPQGSHVLTSLLGADALAMIPSASSGVRAGERVTVELLPRWLGAAA